MNYLAHGLRFRDRPWFLAGTAVPDWLGVADRSVRLRRREVVPHAAGGATPRTELAAGVLQHLDDDRWFHATPAFVETSALLADLFRRALGADNGLRPGFLGHIATEMLLDGVLIEERPQRLDEYYAALAEIDASVVQEAVDTMAGRSTQRLAWFIDRFREAEFLRDYADPARLRGRLDQVLSRVRMGPLPAVADEVLAAGRPIVAGRVRELLPPVAP